MDYFNRFLKKGAVASLTETSATSTPVKVVPLQLPVEVATPSELPTNDASVSLLAEAPHVNELQKEDIRLWDTKILKTVLPHRLVWAPLYRFRNQMFCCRVVESDEIDRDLYIRTPLEEGESVVEFIRAPKTKACDTRLLIVHTKDLQPYYGREGKISEWSEHYLDKMKRVLNERWNKTDTEFVYNEIVFAAQKYLKEALLFEEDLSATIMKQKSPQYRPAKIVFEVVDEEGVALFGRNNICSRTSPTIEHESLAVGDCVAYFSELNVDVVVFARINGFSEDPDVPLILSNGGEVHVTKRLRKLTAVSAEANALGYDPLSGHYRNLLQYSWPGHVAASARGAVADLAAGAEAMDIDDGSASRKETAPTSRRKGAKGASTPSPSPDKEMKSPPTQKGKPNPGPRTAAQASGKKATPKRGTKHIAASASQESEPSTYVESTQDSAMSLAVTVSPPASQESEPCTAGPIADSARKRSRAAQTVAARSSPESSSSAKKLKAAAPAHSTSATGAEVEASDDPVAKRLTRSAKH